MILHFVTSILINGRCYFEIKTKTCIPVLKNAESRFVKNRNIKTKTKRFSKISLFLYLRQYIQFVSVVHCFNGFVFIVATIHDKTVHPIIVLYHVPISLYFNPT